MKLNARILIMIVSLDGGSASCISILKLDRNDGDLLNAAHNITPILKMKSWP